MSRVKAKTTEIWQEFKAVFSGRGNLIDSILPPVLFVALNSLFGFQVALWGALIAAFLITGLRLRGRQPVRYAAGGLGGVLLATLAAKLLDRAEGFFIPSLVSSGVTLVLMVFSLAVRRPLVAWTSYLARRWPREWYWHPQVRPAYTEVTWLWLLVFAGRLALQLRLLGNEDPTLLAAANLLGGWPVTIVLLIVSYLYGTWRLRQLRGPSVAEFQDNSPPPWSGQQSGF